MVYNACLKIIQHRNLPKHGSYNTTWVAFLDVDEFLVLKKHATIQAFVADHCSNEKGLCGSVGINWQWFGTSNHTYFDPNIPVTQRFFYRDYQPHKIIKSIVRVDEVLCITSAHFPHFSRNNPLQNKSQPPFSYDTSGHILWGPYSRQRHDDVAVVNHYTKSLEEWYARRCQRGDVNQRAKNRRCNGKFPDAGYVYDNTASRFYQTHVTSRSSLVRPPVWKHYPESEFGIQEIIPLSQIAPEPASGETASSPPLNKAGTLTSEDKWKNQIPPSMLQSYLPDGFPKPPAAELIRNASTLDGDHSIPPFVKKRHECIARVRQIHQERFESVLPWTRNGAMQQQQQQQPVVLYVDPAYHNNVGDGLLTLGTLTFLLRQGLSDIRQCHYWQSLKRVPPCEEVIPANNSAQIAPLKLAIWQPGGNWGDLWVNAHRERIRSFSTLLDNEYAVVGFPQSLVYRNQTRAEAEAQMIKESIGNGLHVNMDTDHGIEVAKSRVTFSWREQKSYEVASKLYPFVTNIVVPDVAFQLGPYDLTSSVPVDRRIDVILFMRKDQESVIRKYRKQPSLIREIFQKVNGVERELSFVIVDWDDRLELFNPEVQAYHITKEAIYLVSMGKVIVADRLHATILAYLSGVPVVYVDQATGKISKAFEV